MYWGFIQWQLGAESLDQFQIWHKLNPMFLFLIASDLRSGIYQSIVQKYKVYFKSFLYAAFDYAGWKFKHL